jgi:triosephosphate isomerase
MRTPVAAANWKCNTRMDSALALALGLRESIDGVTGVEKVLCPPFVYLAAVGEALRGSSLWLGSQDVHWQDDVAATGEVGPQMVAELATYTIIGHSERRHQFGETDAAVNRKVQAALAIGLQPIMCVGELLSEREAGSTAEVLVRQTRSGLSGVAIPDGFIVAYEPVWAIGTGQNATPEQISTVHRSIRNFLRQSFGSRGAAGARILYGGSVKPENIGEIAGISEVNGVLVGGASLQADGFLIIVREFSLRARRPRV